MATIPFKVSLLDSNGVPAISVNTLGTALTINDQSDYATNNEPGHTPADFTFRRILIEHYKGTIINLSSVNDGDVLIPAPSANVNVFTQNIITGDGRYKITLRSVPSWNNTDSYQASDDCVFIPGLTPALNKFYLCLADNSNVPPAANPLTWQEIPEEDLPIKYNTFLSVGLDTQLRKCLAKKVNNAVAIIKEDIFNDDTLAANKKFLNTVKLLVLLYDIQIAIQNQDDTETDVAFDLAIQICNCEEC